MTRDEIVAEARTYIGTRFKMLGRDRTGIDCIGLPIAVARHFGQVIEDDTSYTFKRPLEFKLNAHLNKHTRPAPIEPLLHGQILKFRQSVLPLHVGILTMDGLQPMVINASTQKRRVVEEPFKYWVSKLLEIREFKGVR
jgi:cell wall-associated NlpC family hydrolase